jgi:hypothetical protein
MHVSLFAAVFGSIAVQSAVGAPTVATRAPLKVLM